MAATIRSFVAVELSDANREELAPHLEECARLAPGYRWVLPDSLHLTLRFLGHLELPALERVRRELQSVRASPFRLTLEGRGTFGSRSAPKVIWLGAGEGRDACRALAEAVEAACQAAGSAPETRGFRAHITLARQRKEGMRLPELPELPPLKPWTVEEFVLFESRLRGQPRYVALERYPLGSDGSNARASAAEEASGSTLKRE